MEQLIQQIENDVIQHIDNGLYKEAFLILENNSSYTDMILTRLSHNISDKKKLHTFISFVIFCNKMDEWSDFINSRITAEYINESISFYTENHKKLASQSMYPMHMKIFMASLHGLGLLNYESFEASGERYFLDNYLGPIRNPVVVDVGANTGGYSTACHECNKSAQIYALEPHPISFKELKKNTQGKRIVALNYGISDEAGSKNLYDRTDLPSGGTSHASLYQNVIEGIHGVASTCFKSEFVTLDNFISSAQIKKIDLLKIDTEGHELSVLKSATNALRSGNIMAIQFEFNEMNIESRVFMKDFFNILPEYDFFRLLPDGYIPLGNINTYRNPLTLELFAMQNIVAIQNSALFPEKCATRRT